METKYTLKPPCPQEIIRAGHQDTATLLFLNVYYAAIVWPSALMQHRNMDFAVCQLMQGKESVLEE